MVVATYILCTAQLSLLFVWKIFFLSQYGDYNNLCIAGKHVLPKTPFILWRSRLSFLGDWCNSSRCWSEVTVLRWEECDLPAGGWWLPEWALSLSQHSIISGWCGVQGVQGALAWWRAGPGQLQHCSCPSLELRTGLTELRTKLAAENPTRHCGNLQYFVISRRHYHDSDRYFLEVTKNLIEAVWLRINIRMDGIYFWK